MDKRVGSDEKTSGTTTTVLPIGSEPEPDAGSESGSPAGPDSDEAAAETAEPTATATATAKNTEAAVEAAAEPVVRKPTDDGDADGDHGDSDANSGGAPAAPAPAPEPPAPRVNRGTRLAERYRLEHRLSQNGRSETWRAVDEKLRRAVGVHIVPAGGEHGRAVIAAARAAALMGDPRFVQVLDCAEQDGLIYVVKEWLPDADNLTKVFESAPLPPHEVYELTRALAQAMSVAHRAGLSHLRLTPENVLRMHTGQYKIVGLAVEAALYGHDTTDAARDDTHAVGRLMYAALTRRWVEGTEYGLQAAPFTGGRLCAPGQIRAGVDDTLAALAMRALGHEVKHEPAFETPGELSAAITAIPEMHPPEQNTIVGGPEPDEYPIYTPTPNRTVYASAGYSGGGRGPVGPARPPVTPPPPLGGRFGAAVKGAVAVLVVLAIVLVTWQVASHVGDGEKKKPPLEKQSGSQSSTPTQAPVAPAPTRVTTPTRGTEISIGGAPADQEDVVKTYDKNRDTYWQTNMMKDGPTVDYNGRKGYGIIYDLGEPMDVRGLDLALGTGGATTTITLKAAPGAASMPSSQDAFTTTVGSKSTDAAEVSIRSDQAIKTQYVLVLMTAMPKVLQDVNGYHIYTPGHQNAWREITFTVNS
ncbi:protein kinase family protein [Embleya sp. NPDC055664]